VRTRFLSTTNWLISAALLGLMILFTLPMPASASLRIVGKSRHTALWQRIYDHLPEGWKTDQTVIVQEVSPADLNGNRGGEEAYDGRDDNENDQDTSIDGDYQEGDEEEGQLPTIRLSSALDDEDAGLVFAHEYGHFIWNEKLTRAQRREYRHLWWQQSESGHLVTEYAGDDPEEGFAEAFSYFVQRPARLRRRDEESWRFLLSLQQDLKKRESPDAPQADQLLQ